MKQREESQKREMKQFWEFIRTTQMRITTAQNTDTLMSAAEQKKAKSVLVELADPLLPESLVNFSPLEPIQLICILRKSEIEQEMQLEEAKILVIAAIEAREDAEATAHEAVELMAVLDSKLDRAVHEEQKLVHKLSVSGDLRHSREFGDASGRSSTLQCGTPASSAAKVLAEVYRLHHVPLPPITLRALLKRGPQASPAIVESLQNDPQALDQWRELNAPAIVTSAQLLHREVPIRIARRIVDLENLPDELPQAEPIVSLRQQLLSSFDQLMSCPLPANLSSERDFMKLHRKIRKEHSVMHGNIADAVQALEYEPQGLSESLDNIYNSRIGIRMLVDQHIAAQTPKPGFTGIVNDQCSPVKIAQEIAHKVRPLWQESLDGQELPEISVSGDESATYRYIPEHIEIILTEVFKSAVLNSIAAAKKTGSSSPPSVHVQISGGSHGVCVKVSDFGGGMTRMEANALCNYYQTPTCQPSSRYDPISEGLERRASGLDFLDSFGLRIAQLYAKYFGGELAIMPMEGHGVDTYIYMNCLTGASKVK
ncbi:hypothetical protein PsorP6_009190 [Peronosclerospora sorghi]|uniref:Uncharacterized protein n=1 Tax=Peronosclerospora sorghi TaxID=230839 RepID=A0ACC0W0M8_9STRA|nr:hypothetical protein PsorP6_009190 [Peronosclerospora sorghi]